MFWREYIDRPAPLEAGAIPYGRGPAAPAFATPQFGTGNNTRSRAKEMGPIAAFCARPAKRWRGPQIRSDQLQGARLEHRRRGERDFLTSKIKLADGTTRWGPRGVDTNIELASIKAVLRRVK